MLTKNIFSYPSTLSTFNQLLTVWRTQEPSSVILPAIYRHVHLVLPCRLVQHVIIQHQMTMYIMNGLARVVDYLLPPSVNFNGCQTRLTELLIPWIIHILGHLHLDDLYSDYLYPGPFIPWIIRTLIFSYLNHSSSSYSGLHE